MTLFQYITWDVDPIAVQLGSFSLPWYSLCWALGLLAAYGLVQRQYKQQGIAEEKFEPLFLYCFLGILIGARLGHCLFYDWEYYSQHLLEIVVPAVHTPSGWKFTGFAGLASHGGTLGLMVALWLYVKRTGVGLFTALDNIAIATPITAFAIRMGNLMNSEIVGTPTEQPWGFVFTRLGEDFARHPGQLYEALAYLCFFGVGLWLYKCWPRRVGTGYFFGFCLASIFTFRFFIEFLKNNQKDFEADMLFNMGQLLSLPFIVLGLYCMWRGARRKA